MAEGTPLEALENGSIQDAADAAKMAEIMRDINASGGSSAPAPQPQMMQSAPPSMMHPAMMHPAQMHMQHQQQHQQQRYVAVDDDEYKPRKKNMWSNISSSLRDPIMVAVLVFVVSLPVLHTQLAKVCGWAFAVGGQLSWLGLIALSLVSGVLFGTMKGAAALVGL